MLGEIFGPDLIIVIVVVAIVVLIGGARLPKIARNLGSARSEFEKGMKDGKATDVVAAPDEAAK